MNFEQEILEAIRSDRALEYKSETANNISGLRCPDCNRKTVFVGIEKPYRLACSHKTSCGYSESTRERYAELFENLSERHPVTDDNPNATAEAFMSFRRGFPLVKIQGWFDQASIKLPKGGYADTVRFQLWDGFYWDRLINEKDIRELGDKAKIKYGTQFRNRCWQPPGQIIEQGDYVKIVEGIFHALALHLSGYKVVAAISSSNLPRDLINANKGKNVTWELAYDSDEAGQDANLKFLAEINELKEAARILLTENGSDWDDVYRDGNLNDDYLKNCQWRGYLLSARSAKHKAFALYCWKPYHHTVINFKKETYSIKIDTTKLTKDLEGAAISFSQHRDLFTNCVTVKHIANCELNFLHIEKDKFTEERKYLFDVFMPDNKKPFLVGFNAPNLGDAKSISTALLHQTDFGQFKGGAQDLDWLTKLWSSQKKYLVETVPFIGYVDDREAYVFPAVGYSDGKCVKTNKHGYIHFNKCSIKTSLGGIEFIHSDIFDQSFLPDFIKVFDLNGVAALAFWTMSLFSQQIKQKQQNLTFLELTGEKEAGKSTLIRFLWKLFGRTNYEGVDVLSLTPSAEARTLSQVSNMPVVFLESDKEPISNSKGGRNSIGVDWERYKKISDLNGAIGSRGVKTNDNQTNDLIFRGSLVISQNATVKASPAILSRIVHLHCTTAHKRIENRPIADRLKSMEVVELAGYLHHALVNEKKYINAFFESFPKHRETLTKTTSIKSMRVIDNHAQVMAAVDALQVLFSNFQKPALDQTLNHLIARAKDRDLRLNAEHPIVQQFWETYHWINDQTMHVKDEDGERDIPFERLNHSSESAFIAVNLNDFFEHCRMRGQELIPIGLLKDVLPESRHYKFLEQKRVYSRIEKAQVRCWVFAKPQNSTTY